MYDLDLICGPGSQLPGQESHSVVSGSKSVSGHPIILLESESSQMTNQKNKGPGRMVKNEQATSSCIKQEETVNPTYRPLHCIADPSLRIDDPRISSKFLDGTAKEGLDQRCSADEIEHKKRQALMRSQAKELAVKKAAGVLQLKQYGVLVSDEIDKTGHSKYIKGLPAREFMPDPLVSSEQSKVLQAVRAGRNVFFTGSAGVGKSFLLKEICRYLQCVRKAFHVTAPTGIAAINVNGTTLHSFAKVGLGTEGWLAYSKRAAGPKQFQLWGETDVLIIDEISMVAPSLFEKIDQIARCARRVNRPLEVYRSSPVATSISFLQYRKRRTVGNVATPYSFLVGRPRESSLRQYFQILLIGSGVPEKTASSLSMLMLGMSLRQRHGLNSILRVLVFLKYSGRQINFSSNA